MILPAPPWMMRRGLVVEEDIEHQNGNWTKSEDYGQETPFQSMQRY